MIIKRFEERRALKRGLVEVAKEHRNPTTGLEHGASIFHNRALNRSVGEFVGLLRPQEVKLIVDVRTIPRSRTSPQYSAAKLAKALSEFKIGYEHIAELGGLRGKKRDVPADVNAFWENQSFHNYADYAMSDEFRSGLARLRELGHETTSAIMCAEAVWWRCHRRIITDYLITAGETVFHILGANDVAPASLTPGAVLAAGGTLSYPDRLLSQNKKVVAKR